MKIKLIFIPAAALCIIYGIILAALSLYTNVWISIIVCAVSVIFIFLIASQHNKPRVLFCDLDGTLIKTLSGKTFPEDCNDWQFRTEVIEAIRNYAPTAIHIISNQGGIEKGYVTHCDFINKMFRITTEMKEILGIPVTFDYCPYNDTGNPYRKPNPGMITQYFYYNDNEDPSHCLMIGDASGRPGQFSDSDLRCADNAGVPYLDVEDFVLQYSKG